MYSLNNSCMKGFKENAVKKRYFLSAVIMNRIFKEDQMKFSIFEIWQVGFAVESSLFNFPLKISN